MYVCLPCLFDAALSIVSTAIAAAAVIAIAATAAVAASSAPALDLISLIFVTHGLYSSRHVQRHALASYRDRSGGNS